ncbi:GMC family oxidoreductase [Pseudomaricurvus alcaniphilus]|uniref:GMC oxidoreductase n=1 Tax=Pseudomaricurvus alcaniphilus TaxID=1166482 RepID=UPI00140D3556|nr:GMC family oxidoreductase [Pseudomaricurvus alcaniphilus]NHN37352.1 GMC family oxidoreductase [Pseudomaricurvus alcaniphilus]
MINDSVTYDAIVIGSGISGGWAAKELCEKGLTTLVLERGRKVEHIKDYHTAMMDPWDFKHRSYNTPEELARQPKQARTGFVTRPEGKHWFVDDVDHPYNEDKRFDWIRGYHVGGRSITWGRQSYRMSEMDFEANLKDGIAVDWPVRYKDIEPWYDYVETHIGVSGQNMGLPHLPDGKLLPPMPLNCVEEHLASSISKNYKGRLLMPGRAAHITGDKVFKGRVKCQFRDRCIRGCPFGAYFSSLSSTLPYAAETGKMTLRPNSIVHSIIYDERQGKATGVRVIDTETKETFEFFAKVIFCCASAIASASILLNSRSDRFPNGMGNDSGELGHNIMDHHHRVGASGTIDGFEEKYYKGRKPCSVYVPRFRNLPGQTEKVDFIRGYGYQGSASRENWERSIPELSIGLNLKEQLTRPGPWKMGLSGFGEVLPHHDNKMYLDYKRTDQWGLPTVTFDCELKDNELKMRMDMRASAEEMLTVAGFKNVESFDDGSPLGVGIHEMGTARMGRDPNTSVLNGHNQVHSVPNVFVTDGAFMTSAACQNPSLSYMAFTARAADYAVAQLKKGAL